MLYDAERVLHDLKVELASKKSHGGEHLLALIARLEAQHAITEGFAERALRLAAETVQEHLLRPAATPVEERESDGHNDGASLVEGLHRSQEDTHAGNGHRARQAH